LSVAVVAVVGETPTLAGVVVVVVVVVGGVGAGVGVDVWAKAPISTVAKADATRVERVVRVDMVFSCLGPAKEHLRMGVGASAHVGGAAGESHRGKTTFSCRRTRRRLSRGSLASPVD
jgi:hypothetical protein